MPQRETKNVEEVLNENPPRSIGDALANWPEHAKYTQSPREWADEILYFLLPDRFAEENISARPLLNRANVSEARPANFRWDEWCQSGSSRFQGGTINGITSQLDYLHKLGITAVWVGPVFRQRVEDNTYHGYGIQHFFDVDARFGSRRDLVELVETAHGMGMKVLLDVIFNHSGTNWLYDRSKDAIHDKPPFLRNGFYTPTYPRSGYGHGLAPGAIASHEDDFVWPQELRPREQYWNKGKGDLGRGALEDEFAENKVCDFENLRSFNTTRDDTLSLLATIYNYWISLTDCDGFRVDTVKHVSAEAARNWVNAVTEHAESLGKDNFFVLGEVAGGNLAQSFYLAGARRNLDAVLDIGSARTELTTIGQGLADPETYFDNFRIGWDDGMGSHRLQGNQHVNILDDHDHVFGTKIRFSANAPYEHQIAAATAIQLFVLGIPCIYYGTEQALRGLPHDRAERKWLTAQAADWLLREAMFGPEHPLASGYDGTQGNIDNTLPGFGPEGTTGHHVFDSNHPAYRRIAALTRVRSLYPAARRGRQYRRRTSILSGPFAYAGAGEMLAWSRIHDSEEVLVIVNTHGEQHRGGLIEVDRRLTGNQMTVACDTANLGSTGRDASGGGAHVTFPVHSAYSTSYVDVPPLGPSEVVILVNKYR
jgi:glycosidase